MTILEAVKAHAQKHYNEDGWDFIVECYTDKELTELIGKCKTVDAAIKKVKHITGIFSEQCQSARNEVF